MKTKEEKRFQVFSHIVLLIFALFCIIPLVLLLMSSFEENSTLIREGYGFWAQLPAHALDSFWEHEGEWFEKATVPEGKKSGDSDLSSEAESSTSSKVYHRKEDGTVEVIEVPRD